MSSKKLYTLYIDCTGDGGWNPQHGKSTTRFYVVAGLSISPDCNLRAYQEVEKILTKYFSNKWNIGDYELCYHDLIQGSGIYSNLTHIERLGLANEIFDVILNLKPTLFATVIDKPLLKSRYGRNAYDPKLLAMRATIHRFAMSLKRESAIGNVTMDAEEYRKDILIQEMVRNFKRDGIQIRGMNYQPMYYENISQIIDTISFTDSKVSTCIQLVDFCSRSTWQHYESSKSKRFSQLSPLWDHNSKVYEPSVFPK
ncbi:MAG: DUF3800 domain-containing protein [Candidatus Bathyarchaeota archaeon]